MRLLINILIPLLIIPCILQADTSILPGPVSGNWSLSDSPYLIEGDITIPDGELLTIEAGVLVEFQGHYQLEVQGTISALGSVDQMIVFTVYDTTGFSNTGSEEGSWHGIRFLSTPTSNDSSRFEYCRIEYGKAIGYSPPSAGTGGGIYIGDFSKVRISRSLITSNCAFLGGGIALEDYAGVVIEETSISGNIALLSGGGIYCSTSEPHLYKVDLSYNTASSGGGMTCSYNSHALIEDSIISWNSSDIHAGGIYIRFGSEPILRGLFIHNNTSTYGAAINCNDNADALIVNTLIHDNHAETSAGAISCGDNSNATLINVTIANNSAAFWGGAFYIYDSQPVLINTICWGDEPDEIYFSDYSQYDNQVYIQYSDIQGGEEGIVTHDNALVHWLEGSIDEDPLLMDTGEHPYSLGELSPCIDTGDPDLTGLDLPEWDIIGNTRIWDGDNDGSAHIDMGAYEFGSPPYTGSDEDLIEPIPGLVLHQNHPNPFNPAVAGTGRNPGTEISYQLSAQSNVKLSVYNIRGQLVRTLVNETKSVGEHSVIWDGSDNYRRQVESGIYLYRLRTENGSGIRKLVIIR